MQSVNLLFVYVSLVLGVGLTLVLLLYNVVAGALFLRESGDGSASTPAKVSWGLGALALMSAVLPCVGAVLGVVAIGLASWERRRIYNDTSSLAGATPVRMGRFNGFTALFVQLVLIASFALGAMVGTGEVDGTDLVDEVPTGIE